MNYATIDDMTTLWRAMTAEEQSRADALIPIVCASLRTEAKKVDMDLDALVTSDEDLALVAKSVTVDVTARTLMTDTNTEPMTQMTESANGYSMQGAFLIPGGGLFIKRSELARLGIKRQRYGVLDIYGTDQRDNN